MNKIIPFIFVILVSSCKKDTSTIDNSLYEKELQNYFLQDLKITQNQIEYKKTRYREVEYSLNGRLEKYERISKLFSEFISKILKENNVKTINLNLENLKKSFKNKNDKKITLLIDKLPIKIENPLQKYRIIRKIKEIELTIYELGIAPFEPHEEYVCFKNNNTQVLATRVNDSLACLFFYSEIVGGHPFAFDNSSISISSITNKKGEKQDFEVNQDFIKTYFVKTKSDTLNLKSLLRTREKIGLLVSRNNSDIIIGKRKIFDDNYLDEYHDSISKIIDLGGTTKMNWENTLN